MSAQEATAALVALLRVSARSPAHLTDEIEAAGSASAVLALELPRSAEQSGDEQRLFDTALTPPRDLEQLLTAARGDLRRWLASGIAVRSILDPGYPRNLRTAHDRPPLLFSRGADSIIAETRAIAVVGARNASPAGLRRAGDISTRLAALEYVVVSGLASGIDAAVHGAALEVGGRTLAVIGTGLHHVHPPQHAELQRMIAARGAVLSQFWPDSPARREYFPLRNALMSGLTRASIIVEAGPRSGTRIQARAALSQGRAVFLHESLLDQSWARELATVPNVHVIAQAEEAVTILERFHARETLTA